MQQRRKQDVQTNSTLPPEPEPARFNRNRSVPIFAHAVLTKADALVLDEPAPALGLGNQALIIDWITRADRTTVIFTTHHPRHARSPPLAKNLRPVAPASILIHPEKPIPP